MLIRRSTAKPLDGIGVDRGVSLGADGKQRLIGGIEADRHGKLALGHVLRHGLEIRQDATGQQLAVHRSRARPRARCP